MPRAAARSDVATPDLPPPGSPPPGSPTPGLSTPGRLGLTATGQRRDPRRAVRWWSLGAALLGCGLLMGLYVTVRGPQATGEYGLDVWLGHRHDAVLNALSSLVDVGAGPVAAPIVLFAATALLWRRSRPASVALAAVTGVGWLSVGVGKLFFHRERPPMQVVHALSFEGAADGFPSGHAAFAAALLLGVIVALRVLRRPTRTAWLFGVPLVVLDGGMRLYAGAHYLGDVLAAPLFASGAAAWLIALWWTVPGTWRTTASAVLAPRVVAHVVPRVEPAAQLRSER